ncbi:hypothetical protein [Polaromonas sp. JS666]|uniref:hypothetical protein n=1 Tax=Polaromonas sp. (strain JS666 / ATCC BAA-500) TaxID=296591 RepID=UPI0000464D78|nr:hypothetical protein [Polaromonas sp. JS666]ABE46935.1 hypothetical protein Bpro_5063 [Polaromonas sp. JS666]
MSNAMEEVIESVPDGTISDPKVMQSARGFYVGTTKAEDGMQVPCNRFSDYMPEHKAQEWLQRAIDQGAL